MPPTGSEVADWPDLSSTLPLVWRRSLTGWLAAAAGVAFLGLSYAVWVHPPNLEAEPENRQALLGGTTLLLRVAFPLLTAVAFGVAVRSRERFAVHPGGIELGHWYNRQRFPWANVLTVRLHEQGGTRLQIFLRNSLPLTLPLGRRAREFRDAMLVAALMAGVHLTTDRRSSPKRQPAPGPTAALALPKAVTVLAAVSGRAGLRGAIRLRVRDEVGGDHEVELTERGFRVEADHAAVRSLPGRLYFDDQLVAVGSADESRLIELLDVARIAPQLDPVPESWAAGLTAADSPEQAAGLLRRLLAFLDSTEYR